MNKTFEPGILYKHLCNQARQGIFNNNRAKCLTLVFALDLGTFSLTGYTFHYLFVTDCFTSLTFCRKDNFYPSPKESNCSKGHCILNIASIAP